MKAALARGVELTAVLAVVALAAVQVWQGLGDPFREVCAIFAACVGLIGIAAGEMAASARSAPEPETPEAPEAVLREAMDRVLLGIRDYFEENVIYRSDLQGIDAGLAAVTDPARAREAIVALRQANQRMESHSSKLSEELEVARLQIVRLRETVDEAERLALLDELTQIGNRRFFDRTLKTDMAACAASGTDLCLAIADIDRFKAVNDRFGHVVGDHLLRAFADALTRGSNGRARTARYGGEEFALILPGVSFPDSRRLVEALRREIEAKRWVVGPQAHPLGPVTASFGVAKLAPGESVESFVHRADSRLMRAKALGRNRVVADDGVAPASRAAG